MFLQDSTFRGLSEVYPTCRAVRTSGSSGQLGHHTVWSRPGSLHQPDQLRQGRIGILCNIKRRIPCNVGGSSITCAIPAILLFVSNKVTPTHEPSPVVLNTAPCTAKFKSAMPTLIICSCFIQWALPKHERFSQMIPDRESGRNVPPSVPCLQKSSCR